MNAQGEAETLSASADAHDTGQNGWGQTQPQLTPAPNSLTPAPTLYHPGLALCSHLPRDQDDGRIGGSLPGRAEVMDKLSETALSPGTMNSGYPWGCTIATHSVGTPTV